MHFSSFPQTSSTCIVMRLLSRQRAIQVATHPENVHPCKAPQHMTLQVDRDDMPRLSLQQHMTTQTLLLLQSRDIDGETGLSLVRDGPPDLLWRYLDYLVCQQGSGDPALHTQLALTLADVALQLQAPSGVHHLSLLLATAWLLLGQYFLNV